MKNDAKTEKKTKTEESANSLLLRAIVAAFTQHPEAMKVEVAAAPGGEMLSFKVHQDDHPRVVGAMGKHIQALRTIFQFIGARDGRQIRLMLLEPSEGRRGPVQQFVPNLKWDEKPTRELLETILGRIFTQPFAVDIFSAEETTNVEIGADAGEFEIADALTPHLQPIFHAIGKQEGRQIYMTAKVPIPVGKK